MNSKVIFLMFPPEIIWRKFLKVGNSIDTGLIIYVVFLIVFFISCSSDKSIKTIIINPENIIEKQITLYEIADEITYIPLSNEILFGDIVSVELTDSLIFVTPTNEGLLTYNCYGRLKSCIGKKGRGPGEYRSASNFTLDRKNSTVYILDSVNDKIFKYSILGDFLQEIRIKSEGQSFFSDIIHINGHLYLFEGINQGYGKYNWIVVDTLGEILNMKLNPIEKFPSFHGCNGNKQEAFNNTFYYWNQINDTIFKINEEKYNPAFLFSKGDFRFPKQKIDGFSNKYFYPRRIYFTRNYLIFSFNYQFRYCSGIYVKSEHQLYLVNKTENKELWQGPGIINDFDGGLALNTLSYYSNNENEEYLIGKISPFQLKGHVASEAFKNATPKYLEKKKELEKLANSLNENDNPVLMLVKLKE